MTEGDGWQWTVMDGQLHCVFDMAGSKTKPAKHEFPGPTFAMHADRQMILIYFGLPCEIAETN